MSHLSFRTSPPDPWTLPRPHRDASQRYMSYGPLVPMDDEAPSLPSFWRRLLGGR